MNAIEQRLEADNTDLRSIFRRCVDIIGFHNGSDADKLEAVRRTMLQAGHLKTSTEETANG